VRSVVGVGTNYTNDAKTVRALARFDPERIAQDDEWFELEQPVAMKRHIPGAELLIFNHAGHAAQQTHPHLVDPVDR
jgi:pimeloyl-ACP methyl ester carboxylesterase